MAGEPRERRSAPRAEDPNLMGRRSEGRACLVLPAAAEAISGHLQVTLLEVSLNGARVEGYRLPGPGKEIILKCGSLDTFGTISWAAAGRCGIQFDEPISVQELLELRKLADVTGSGEMTPAEREAAEHWQSGFAR